MAAALAVGLGCEAPLDPYPQPLPPNIDISVTPSAGDSIEVADADSVVLQFSRRMDPESVWLVRRLSFLLPITVDRLDGNWNQARTRLVFRLNRFPIQPGATYEALLVGLRTADGELYNRGSLPILFHTRGEPDLFPFPPLARVAARDFCRRASGTKSCSETLTMVATPIGTDSLVLATSCEDCGGFRRADYFRKTPAGVEWLGFDLPETAAARTATPSARQVGLPPVPAHPGAGLQSVRWPAPPMFLGSGTRAGDTWTAPAQTGSDGTRLLAWQASDTGIDSPSEAIDAGSLTLQVTFPRSHVLRLDYALESPDGVIEHRQERWWLHPGVGLVRREQHVERSDSGPIADSTDAYVPGLSLLLP